MMLHSHLDTKHEFGQKHQSLSVYHDVFFLWTCPFQHSNVLQALHADAKASLEVVPIKVTSESSPQPSPTNGSNGTWAQGYDLSHALPQLPQLSHFCKQIWTFARSFEVVEGYTENARTAHFFAKNLPLVPSISQHSQLEQNYLYWIPHDFTSSPPFSIIWCFGAWVPGSPHHRFQPSSQHVLQLRGVQRGSVTPRTPSAPPATFSDVECKMHFFAHKFPRLPLPFSTRIPVLTLLPRTQEGIVNLSPP